MIANIATDPKKIVIDSRGEESPRMRKQDKVFQLALKIKEILLDGLEAELIALALFGSAARGTLRVGSDLDFLVVLRDPPRSYPKRTRIVLPFWVRIQDTKEYAALERLGMGWEPSFLILSADELKEHPPVLLDMVEEAVILCDPEACLQRELEALRQRLKALGSIKKRLPDGSWYWVLKPDIHAGEVIEL